MPGFFSPRFSAEDADAEAVQPPFPCGACTQAGFLQLCVGTSPSIIAPPPPPPPSASTGDTHEPRRPMSLSAARVPSAYLSPSSSHSGASSSAAPPANPKSEFWKRVCQSASWKRVWAAVVGRYFLLATDVPWSFDRAEEALAAVEHASWPQGVTGHAKGSLAAMNCHADTAAHVMVQDVSTPLPAVAHLIVPPKQPHLLGIVDLGCSGITALALAVPPSLDPLAMGHADSDACPEPYVWQLHLPADAVLRPGVNALSAGTVADYASSASPAKPNGGGSGSSVSSGSTLVLTFGASDKCDQADWLSAIQRMCALGVNLPTTLHWCTPAWAVAWAASEGYGSRGALASAAASTAAVAGSGSTLGGSGASPTSPSDGSSPAITTVVSPMARPPAWSPRLGVGAAGMFGHPLLAFAAALQPRPTRRKAESCASSRPASACMDAPGSPGQHMVTSPLGVLGSAPASPATSASAATAAAASWCGGSGGSASGTERAVKVQPNLLCSTDVVSSLSPFTNAMVISLTLGGPTALPLSAYTVPSLDAAARSAASGGCATPGSAMGASMRSYASAGPTSRTVTRARTANPPAQFSGAITPRPSADVRTSAARAHTATDVTSSSASPASARPSAASPSGSPTSPPPAQPRQSDVLGEGSFGRVLRGYRQTGSDAGLPVAIKIVTLPQPVHVALVEGKLAPTQSCTHATATTDIVIARDALRRWKVAINEVLALERVRWFYANIYSPHHPQLQQLMGAPLLPPSPSLTTTAAAPSSSASAGAEVAAPSSGFAGVPNGSPDPVPSVSSLATVRAGSARYLSLAASSSAPALPDFAPKLDLFPVLPCLVDVKETLVPANASGPISTSPLSSTAPTAAVSIINIVMSLVQGVDLWTFCTRLAAGEDVQLPLCPYPFTYQPPFFTTRDGSVGADAAPPVSVSARAVMRARCAQAVSAGDTSMNDGVPLAGLPEPIAKFLVRDVALALAQLQAMGVVHRDVKAENVQIVAVRMPSAPASPAGATPVPAAADSVDNVVLRAVMLDLGFAYVSNTSPYPATMPSEVTGVPDIDDAVATVAFRTLFGTKHAAPPEIWIAADVLSDAALGRCSAASTTPASASGGAPIVPAATYSAAVDSWGLGIVMFVVLFGMLPFDEIGGVAELKANILGGKMVQPQPRWSHVSQPAKDLLGYLLNVDAFARFTPAAALLHAWLL